MSKDLVNIIKTRKFIKASLMAGLIITGPRILSSIHLLFSGDNVGQNIATGLEIILNLFISVVILIAVIGSYVYAYRLIFSKIATKKLMTKPNKLAKLVVISYVIGNFVSLIISSGFDLLIKLWDMLDQELQKDLSSLEVIISAVIFEFVIIPSIIYYFAKKRATDYQKEIFS